MKRIWLVLVPVITIVLEALPYGAVLNFASSPTDIIKRTYSYFSLTPFGYANFAPLITALLTCLILLLALLSIKIKGICKAVFIISIIAAIVSLGPLLYGMHFYSVVGGAITVLLAGESVLARLAAK